MSIILGLAKLNRNFNLPMEYKTIPMPPNEEPQAVGQILPLNSVRCIFLRRFAMNLILLVLIVTAAICTSAFSEHQHKHLHHQVRTSTTIDTLFKPGFTTTFFDAFIGIPGTLPSFENWIFDIGTSYPGGPERWGNNVCELSLKPQSFFLINFRLSFCRNTKHTPPTPQISTSPNPLPWQ
jgi:hypothetical protein